MNLELSTKPQIPVGKPSLTPEGEALIEATIARSGMIGRVSNDSENESSVKAQLELKAVIKELEDFRILMTRPALEYQRELKAYFDGRIQPLKDEMWRVGKLSGDYVQLQEMKRRAEENARKEELAKLDRERQQALANVQSHEEAEAVQAHFSERAAVESVTPPNPVTIHPKGQSIKDDWEIEITDRHLFARCYPSCVEIKERVSEIKSLLRAGVKMEESQGIRVRAKINVGVRLPASKMLDV